MDNQNVTGEELDNFVAVPEVPLTEDELYERDLARATAWLEANPEEDIFPDTPDPFQMGWEWLRLQK